MNAFSVSFDAKSADCPRTDAIIPLALAELKLQMRQWLACASEQAHLAWIIDSAESLSMTHGDWEWLQTVCGDRSVSVVVACDRYAVRSTSLVQHASHTRFFRHILGRLVTYYTYP